MGDYFNWLRRDVLALVPPDAKSVLSIGCGSGATEEVLVRKGIRVVGVEINHEAASEAKSRGIEVIVKDIGEALGDLDGREFDCLICADVLEHIVNADVIFCFCCNHLVSGGTAVVSVPNFRHLSVFWQLFFKGGVEYKKSGIFDTTHVRMTTRNLVCSWMSRAGLIPVRTQYIIHGRRYRWPAKMLLSCFDEFLSQQLIVVGTKS